MRTPLEFEALTSCGVAELMAGTRVLGFGSVEAAKLSGRCSLRAAGSHAAITKDARHEDTTRVESRAHAASVCSADVIGCRWAACWLSSTRLRLCGSCKAQIEVLVASDRIDVHNAITKHAAREAVP